jgi:hypothetical protein
MHALDGFILDGRHLVAGEMRQLCADDRAERVMHRDISRKVDLGRLAGFRGAATPQSIAAIRLASEFHCERRLRVKLERQSIERLDLSRLELDFELAHGLGRRARFDLADIDRHLGQPVAIETQIARTSSDVGHELRTEAPLYLRDQWSRRCLRQL